MTNLTIVVDDDLLKRARIRAVEEGTSVNEICRKAIEQFAGERREEPPQALIARIRALAAEVQPSTDGQPLWPGREALYEEALRERGLMEDARQDPPAPRPRAKR